MASDPVKLVKALNKIMNEGTKSEEVTK